MTPTIPLPAVTRSLSLGMYEKSWVNELMLRSAGTVALGVFDVVVPPPQAIATIPTTPSVGTSLANLIWFYLLSKWLPVAFFPAVPGRECAGEQALLRSHGGNDPRGEHCSPTQVCQECDGATHTICSNS